MMDPNIRRRFELMRPQLSNPDPGIAAAAKNVWDTMVKKYGDPDERPKSKISGNDVHFFILDDIGKEWSEFTVINVNIADDISNAWSKSRNEAFIQAIYGKEKP